MNPIVSCRYICVYHLLFLVGVRTRFVGEGVVSRGLFDTFYKSTCYSVEGRFISYFSLVGNYEYLYKTPWALILVDCSLETLTLLFIVRSECEYQTANL